MTPVIAITPAPAALPRRAQRAAVFARAITTAGGTPWFLTPADQSLDRAHGLLLVGGGDPAERHYPQPLTAAERQTLSYVDPALDEWELGWIGAALARDCPVLGVCRGLQMLALAGGGSLWPDIAQRLPGALAHQADDPLALAHAVDWEPATRLGDWLGASCQRVTSSHHQAVSEPPAGWVVGGRAPDGVIEAIENPAARFCCGVQFHPERMPGAARLLAEFVKAATG